jgi:hypothetical protein
MDPLNLLREKIPQFAGYADDRDRERSDELVRSYLGEAVAEMQVRLGNVDGNLEKRLGDLLIRVGFANQAAYKIYADAARKETHFDRMAAADARTVELAEGAAGLQVSDLGAFLEEAARVLDERDAAMDGEQISYR